MALVLDCLASARGGENSVRDGEPTQLPGVDGACSPAIVLHLLHPRGGSPFRVWSVGRVESGGGG